ncbi:SDR family oxidoreductase [Sphingobium sufflavum]|uniref:SDR family NAD(P)-dependent oxidoreductase n=1 Tax=Sphingobium sufflavum TaxID=1129547 RepID=UPI001F18EC6D|nr:SDR family oxidoreductase [Sphingobium sufflavum]MCE7798479.1 SDR family oxidoreductase [Sphingobium sufflavum]
MMRRLEGKVILVAGAGGIGSALARRYATEGAAVVLGDLDGAAAQAVAAEIAGEGGQAVGTSLDGSQEASIAAAVALAVASYGGLDGLHANFASFRDGESGADVLGLPLDIYDEVMRVNARGFLLCTRHTVPEMLKRGSGSIVYTSSGAAHMPDVVRVAYAMSKAAGHALMRHVAKRFGPEGIRANVIAPGVIRHAKFDAVMDPAVVTAMAERIPVGRLGEGVDIAALGALLMSDEGSFISGQVLSVDGGGSMRL